MLLALGAPQGREVWLELLAGADSAAVQYVLFIASNTRNEDLIVARCLVPLQSVCKHGHHVATEPRRQRPVLLPVSSQPQDGTCAR